MACSLTQGHTPKTCKSSGGTKSFLIAEFDAITAITKTAGVISAITKASGKKFWKYKQKAEVAMWKQTGTGDPKVGTIAYDVEANIEMVGLDQVGQTELGLLMANTVVMIAEDNDGSYWFLGEDFGMDLATDGLESGTAIGDFRGNKLAFKGRAFTRVASVDPTIITALLA
jgi:hypothetical protein